MTPGTAPPSPSIPPAELFVRLSQRKRPARTVDLPVTDAEGKPFGQVAIRVLNQGEVILAEADATRYAKTIIKEKFESTEKVEGYAQVYNNALACEMLYRCCRRVENEDLPFFPTASDVRKSLTNDECTVLLNAYSILQNELGPIPEMMTDEVREAWIKRLREGGTAVPLAWLTPAQKDELLMYSISRSPSFPEVSGSSGSPLEENTTDS